MTVTLKTQKMLWGRAAGRCSEPNCRIDLYFDETETDDPTAVGENCHMVAESDDGPRANPSMPIERRNSYSNLILLCRNHHKVIDAQEHKYTVEVLRNMKDEHELWVRSQLGLDEKKQRDDEQYATIIDQWEKLVDIDHWQAWSSAILCHDQPRMSRDLDQNIDELRGWLLNRIWPQRYPLLENSIENFRRVLGDFHEVFRRHATTRIHGRDTLWTEKFYKIKEWDEDRYNQLLLDYHFHVDLVSDLMLEVTRAANLICDRVRADLLPSYRLHQGRLVVQRGPTMDFAFHDYVVQYSTNERDVDFPYPGLDSFCTLRKERDLHFGEGLGRDR